MNSRACLALLILPNRGDFSETTNSHADAVVQTAIILLRIAYFKGGLVALSAARDDEMSGKALAAGKMPTVNNLRYPRLARCGSRISFVHQPNNGLPYQDHYHKTITSDSIRPNENHVH